MSVARVKKKRKYEEDDYDDDFDDDYEEDEFSEAGTLVLEDALDMQDELPEEGSGNFDSFLKLEQGRNVLRFLPPDASSGRTVPWVFTWQHGWGGGSNYRTVNCPRMMSRPPKPCPICARRAELLESSRKADKKSAGALKPKLRVITEVVDVTTEESGEKGVQLFAYGRQINDALAGILQAGKLGGDFTHKRKGFPILIVRDGTGVDTSYPTVSATPDRSPVEGHWLLDRKDLSRFTKLPTREEMESALKAMGIRGSSAHDDDDEPPQRRSARGRIDEDVYDIDDDDFEDDYEDEPVRPKRRAKAPPRRRK